jgi:hypothetical protein
MHTIVLGIGLLLGLILINRTIAYEESWIIFLYQHGGRIWVTDLETVSGVTDGLRLFLGDIDSPLV